MATCSTCNNYYRLSAYHNDPENCEDCSTILPKYYVDSESDLDIYNILHPQARTEAVRYDE